MLVLPIFREGHRLDTGGSKLRNMLVQCLGTTMLALCEC